MNIVQLIEYLQNLADDFEMTQRKPEAKFLREAAAIVARSTTHELTRLTVTMGDEVFDMMTGTK
jgi:hypothetical protein